MRRELFILRHGKVQKAHAPEGSGQELKDKGKRNAQRMGAWLARKSHLPDFVVSSPAPCAVTTAQKCCKSAGLNADVVTSDARLYQGTVADVMDVVHELPKTARRVMVVGHNPSLEHALLALARSPVPRNAKNGILLPGALAHLRIDDQWLDVGAGCAKVLDIIEPKALPRLFPFPSPDGAEQRSRPAYYYRQSSVVPFRRGKKTLEVLVISSSKQKHWVIPKGIHEPGLSAQQSAAKEAFEEAGVEGRVLDRMIATYSYNKWGSTCDVEVYPMEVSAEISDSAWEEPHRIRQWVSVEQAVSMVLNDNVKRIIARLPDVIGGAP